MGSAGPLDWTRDHDGSDEPRWVARAGRQVELAIEEDGPACSCGGDGQKHAPGEVRYHLHVEAPICASIGEYLTLKQAQTGGLSDAISLLRSTADAIAKATEAVGGGDALRLRRAGP